MTFEFCDYITTWKMMIFDKVNYVGIEPALDTDANVLPQVLTEVRFR